MPFKMMGKSPLMKKLVGNQSRLPEHLKAKIEAAPESPAKLKKASPAKNNGTLSQDFNNAYNYFLGDGKKTANKDGVQSITADAAQGITSNKTEAVLAEEEKTKERLKNQREKDLFEAETKEEDKFFEEFDFQKDNKDTSTKGETQKIAEVEQKETKIGTGKPLVFGRTNKFGSDSINAGREAMSGAGSTSTVAENIKNNVTDKVQVGSGSTKRLPIDAVQDRLTKNIDRRTRKSDVRKQTRTAKQSLRQEGFKRSAARDKVGKLGINPNTGKSFDNAKQKQDFINAKGKDTFVSDLQKKIGKTMKKSGVDSSSSNKKETGSTSKVPKIDAFGGQGPIGGQSFGINSKTRTNKKATGDNFLNNLKSNSKPPNLKGAGKKITEGVSFGTKTSKQKSSKKFNPVVENGYTPPTEKQKNKTAKGESREKSRQIRKFKNEETGKRIKRGETNKKFFGGKMVDGKVQLNTKRQALKDEKEKRKNIGKTPVKKTVGKFKVNKPPTPPAKMKTKTPSKMMKKSPNKMMKKKSPTMMMKKTAAPKMMKKAPAKMMKKKKK